MTTVLNLNFARFLNILIVTCLVNRSRTDKTKIPFKVQFIMWLAGLRGAMAYALALKCAKDLEIGPVILIDTLIYAFITILVVGSILNPTLSKLGVKRKDIEEIGGLEIGGDQASCAKRAKSRLSAFNARTI